jgi:predicted membrane channel-forming protein YqfA (hemolysin III family)
MFCSASYHLYNSLSIKAYNILLKFDLIGIGLNITGLAMTLIYTGFHNYSNVGFYLVCSLGLLMVINFGLQMTPCYMQDKYEKFRLLFFVVIIASLFGVAICWTFFVATSIELEVFFLEIMKSFGYVGLGFFFYITKFPERYSSNYYVQMFLQAHIWWHIFTFLNGYILYWLLLESLKHMEKYTSIELELVA